MTAPATTSRAVLNDRVEQSLHHPPKYDEEHSLTSKTGAPQLSIESLSGSVYKHSAVPLAEQP